MAIESNTIYDTPQGKLRLIVVHETLVQVTAGAYKSYLYIEDVQEKGMIISIQDLLDRCIALKIPSLVTATEHVLKAVTHVMINE